MTRPFLFMAGDFKVTMPAAFTSDLWTHTMIAQRFAMNDDGTFRREKVPSDRLRGVIWYCSLDDQDILVHNLAFIKDNKIPCWPNIDNMILWCNRINVLISSKIHKLCTDDVSFNNISQPFNDDYIGFLFDCHSRNYGLPFVVKSGNLHCGQGKFLVNTESELLDIAHNHNNGAISVEPFFIGESCRVLIIGDMVFGIKYHNDNSWIKNSLGCEPEEWNDIPEAMLDHAKKVHDHFGFDISGIDYVVGEDGFHFLEFNHFPGVDNTDEIRDAAKSVFIEAMTNLENNL